MVRAKNNIVWTEIVHALDGGGVVRVAPSMNLNLEGPHLLRLASADVVARCGCDCCFVVSFTRGAKEVFISLCRCFHFMINILAPPLGHQEEAFGFQ